MKKIGKIYVFIIFYGISVIVLVSCSRQKFLTDLPMYVPETFSISGIVDAPERWWTVFEDERLNTTVDSALRYNFNLEAVWQRLIAAQAVYARESASFFPFFDASVQADIAGSESDIQENENFRVGLSTSYEIDLWGRIRSAVKAERYRSSVALSDYQTAAISLSSEIVSAWYQLTEAYSQLKLVNEQIEINEKALELMRIRFGSGQIRGVDILRQRQLLEATREQKILDELRIQLLQHQLLVLLGQSPVHEIDFVSEELPVLPPLPATGIPVDLIQRRPDVQSAYNLLLAADSELASAISSRFPRLSISASVYSTAGNINNLFEDWAYAVAGNLLAPLFYGRRLAAEVNRSKAVTYQLFYEYGQTVLVAFREVEDALIREKKQAEIIQSLQQQVDLAAKASEQLQIEYFNGLGDYLEVLTSLSQEQQLRRDLLSEKLALLEYRISLYRALAGSFVTHREPGNNG